MMVIPKEPDPNDNGFCLNVLGRIGSGKSSFFNSCADLYKDYKDKHELEIDETLNNYEVEIDEEGLELFQNFVFEEIQLFQLEGEEIRDEEGLRCLVQDIEDRSCSTYLDSFVKPSKFCSMSEAVMVLRELDDDFASTSERKKLFLKPSGFFSESEAGMILRELADGFANTRERKIFKEKAHEMGAGSKLIEVMREMLSTSNITRERVVALYCLCSDVIIRSWNLRPYECSQFLRSCVGFITAHIYPWVCRNGGWIKALQDQNFDNMNDKDLQIHVLENSMQTYSKFLIVHSSGFDKALFQSPDGGSITMCFLHLLNNYKKETRNWNPFQHYRASTAQESSSVRDKCGKNLVYASQLAKRISKVLSSGGDYFIHYD